ncbi:MAG TPA: polysaccharide lyase family protein [Terriglobales bacterium]|nr:polysaccharide lyase family protein [Terriglobales bacterium]
MKTSKRWAFVALAVVLSSLSIAATAQSPRLVWRVGEFNDSSGEFRSQDIEYANPKSDPVYIVGKSTDQDWLRFQPGPANGMTGARLHPFTIRFNLKEQPRGVYRLKIAILYETPRLSFLKLIVNGHSGFFYFHPKLDFAAGDWEGTFVPQTSTDTKVISIPASWLKQGDNEFVLTAMDDPPTRQDSLGAIAPGHTGIVYDALELTNEPAGKYDGRRFSALVEPTIFYQQKDGLKEIVNVFTDFESLPANCTVTLSIGKSKIRQDVRANEAFGERKLAFLVPEFSGKATATVQVSGSGLNRTVRAEMTPAKKWTVFIIPHEHLDVGFTDYVAKVAELQSQSVDDAMNVIQKVPDFRWTLDGSWVAQQYIAGRSQEAQQRFFKSVRKGDVVIPPEFANQHTGNASLEGLIRTFYDSHQLALKNNLPEQQAAQTVDVPSYTWSFASVLHDAGIKYFLGASNSWRAPIMLLGRWNEKSPFYWEGPDGGRVLMWYSRAYLQMHTLFGGPWRMEAVQDSLPVFLQAYTRPDYTANSAIIFGSQLENTPFAKEQAELPATWNAQYAYPHLEFGTVQSAMSRIEKETGGKFPVYRGDFGPYWEDGYGSDAKYTANHRENQERILTAEKMSVLPAILSPILRPDVSPLKKAWENELLYDEHTWTYVGATSQPEHTQSVKQIALKESRVLEAKNEIDDSIQRSFAQLAGFLSPKQNSLMVFNSLGWKRSGMIDVDLQDGMDLFDNTANKPVPYQVLFVGKGIELPGFGKGYKRVRFEARDVPEFGYKLYSFQPGERKPAESQAVGDRNVLENQYYRVTLDVASGAIASILDKQLGKELVDQKSPYKFGSYLYVTGGDDIPNNSLYRFGAGLKPPKLTVHPAEDGNLIDIKQTPFGTAATLESSSVNTPRIRTEITLYNTAKKIEIRVDLHKNRVLTRESAYIAFPAEMTNPSFIYGNQIGWVDPAKDELPGGSREWYVARHWTIVSDSAVSMTIVPVDAPLVAFGDIVRGNWPSEFKPKSSTVFSWLMNNYWGTNFPAWQGGDYTFRYVITSGTTLNAVEAERFGREAMTPLETTELPAGIGPTNLPATEAALVEIDNPNVAISTWKMAEDGKGTVLRLQETSGTVCPHVWIRSDHFKFSHVWRATALEDKLEEIPIRDGGDIELSLQPFETLTLRVETVIPPST